jgi:hypothetical protein
MTQGAGLPDRAMTGLLAWPLSGQPPRQLASTRADLAAGSGEIAAVSAALREAADRAPERECSGAFTSTRVHD